MREGWCEIKLAQCVNNITKFYEIKTTNYEMAGNYPIVSQSEDLIAGYTDDDKFVIHLEKPVIVFGDHTRIIKFVDFDFCVGADGVKILSSKDFISPKYLFHFLQYKKVPSLGYSRHYKLLKEIDVIYPKSLSIQSKISDELDMITEMISKYDEQLKELDKLSQSIFYEMFGDPIENEKGWEVKTLKNISEKITSGNNAKLAIGTYKSEGIPYFRCQNVWKNRIDFKDMVYIDEETNQKLKSSVLKHNDLLITKIGRINTENSSLGRVSIYKGEDFQANLSGNLCFIRLLDTVNPSFVLNIMISNYFRDYIRRTTVGGTDKRALKSPQIGRFPIILPPLTLQQSSARKIEAIEAMKSKVREAKKEAEALLAARMQYWVE